MTRFRFLLAIAATGAAALVIAACGGGDSDEDKIREVIVDLATASEGACNLVTDRLLDDEFNGKRGCERALEDAEDTPSADDVEVRNIEIDGKRATAEVEQPGEGESRVELVEEDGDWKIDEVEDTEDSGEDTETETEAESTTKEEFSEGVAAACRETKSKSDDLEEELDRLEQGDTEGVARVFSRLAGVYRDDLLEPVRKLGTPTGDAAEVGRITGTIEALVAQTEKAAEAVSGGDSDAIRSEAEAAQSTQGSVGRALEGYDISDCELAE